MGKHILLVDDSTTIRTSVASCLRKASYQVTEAVNGLDALEKLELLQARGEQVSPHDGEILLDDRALAELGRQQARALLRDREQHQPRCAPVNAVHRAQLPANEVAQNPQARRGAPLVGVGVDQKARRLVHQDDRLVAVEDLRLEICHRAAVKRYRPGESIH